MSETPTIKVPGRAFSERHIEVGGLSIRYYEAGRGEALVHVHGAGGPEFSRALDLLAETYRVIVIELPGFGESAIDDRTRGSAKMVGTLAEFIRALEVAPANVWGTSMGGGLATWLAVEHPAVVKSLVLQAPGAFRGEAASDPTQLSPEELARARNSHPERVSRPDLTELDPARRELIGKLLGPAHDAELEQKLPQIDAPTLVVWGIDDGIIPATTGRIYKRLIPQCAYILLHNAAHDVQGDRPEACAELVGDFQARGLQFVVDNQDGRINP